MVYSLYECWTFQDWAGLDSGVPHSSGWAAWPGTPQGEVREGMCLGHRAPAEGGTLQVKMTPGLPLLSGAG